MLDTVFRLDQVCFFSRQLHGRGARRRNAKRFAKLFVTIAISLRPRGNLDDERACWFGISRVYGVW